MKLEQTAELVPGYVISRVIRGGWQLAGGHGAVDRQAVEGDLLAYYEAGITTFDCADIYTGVEEMIGAFRANVSARQGAEAGTYKPTFAMRPRIDCARMALSDFEVNGMRTV